jgi:hypothetical protein
MRGRVNMSNSARDLGCVCKMQDKAASRVQVARCFVCGEHQIGIQKACADLPRCFPRLIRIAPQVVAGGALVEFWR